MAVTLRLARHGQKKRPFYRIVAAEKQARRDGRFIEIVGNYDPLTTPPTVNLKEEKVRRWISVGAQVSASVGTLLKKHFPNLLEERKSRQREKIVAARKARKTRTAGSGGTKKGSTSKAKAAKPRSSKKA